MKTDTVILTPNRRLAATLQRQHNAEQIRADNSVSWATPTILPLQTWLQQCWQHLRPDIDDERWQAVQMRLDIQQKDAVEWRNACLLYFQTFSRMPLPDGFERPDHTLDYYEKLQLHYAPGTGQ